MISLQFVQGSDFSAKAIEWVGHGAEFSHVDTVWPDGRLFGARSDRVGGAEPGVQFRRADYVQTDRVLRVDLPCSDDITGKYRRFHCRAQLG